MKRHIPKHKDDIESVNFLKSCSFNEIKLDIPVLLEYLQDTHWELAHAIGMCLIPYVNDIKEELIAILESNDCEWKFGILYCLIGKSQKPLDQKLVDILTRISQNPTVTEKEEELDIIAMEIITGRQLP